MFRYCLRTLLILLALLPLPLCFGCTTDANPPPKAAARNATQRKQIAITKEQAIEIVRSKLGQDDQVLLDCVEVPEGYRVTIRLFGLDEDGNQAFYFHGDRVYVLSKSGKVLHLFGGW